MGHLSYLTLHERVEMELSQTTIPNGLVRRLGADQYTDKVLPDFSRRLNSIDQLLEESIVDLSRATTMLASLVNEFTSFLYAVGASHDLWRHWSSLTGFGLFLSGEIHRAGQYSALGGEWEFLKVLPDRPVKSLQEADLVTWMLISGNPASELPKLQHEYSNAWLKLARSIPAKDHKTTEESLKAIADFWMEETGGDWNNFCYGRYPVFETPICAVAALARHQGFVPTSLTSAQYSFLEAGLAEPEPPPMFPTLFSLPESPGNYQ
jgi:hypothetical protein